MEVPRWIMTARIVSRPARVVSYGSTTRVMRTRMSFRVVPWVTGNAVSRNSRIT